MSDSAIVHVTGTPDLTIRELETMGYGTAKANGWHDRKGEILTEAHPYAQIAVLSLVTRRMTDVIEHIRKPQDQLKGLPTPLDLLRGTVLNIAWAGMVQAAKEYLEQTGEYGKPAEGSKCEMIAWLQLIITEASEAIEAVVKGDRENFAEELAADIPIRIGDTIGAINDMPGHFLGPIDMTAAIRAKNEKNKARGYRHGDKKA